MSSVSLLVLTAEILMETKTPTSVFLKGIVSRDWGGLQMILLDRYIVVNISAGGSF